MILDKTLYLFESVFLSILAIKITSKFFLQFQEASLSIQQCLLDVFQSSNPLPEDFSVC